MTANRLFGTNGIRGEVNKLLTPALSLSIGRAVGTVVRRSSPPGTEVLVATDTRYSGDMLKAAICAGLLSTGCQAVDTGMLPTPALQYGVKKSTAAMGLIITASHNPPEYNGIKCVAGDGTETTQDEEKEIEEIYFSEEFTLAPWNAVLGLLSRSHLTHRYTEDILAQVDRELIASKRFGVVVDCANGATVVSAPKLLESLGTKLVTLNAQSSGGFPGHPSEPTEDNLRDLMTMVKNTGAAMGLAHDGDGDRAIFVDERGEFLYGDKTLALVAKHIVMENGGGKVVTAINTSNVLEDVVKEAGGEVIYTPIGSPIVARVMIKEKAVFGGEENGGLIFPKFQYCRDGGMTSAAILEILANRERSLSELMGEMPEYHLCKLKFKYPPHLREKILEKYLSLVKDKNPLTLDGIKVLDDTGWVLVRPSGTETIYRIQVEDSDPVRANKKADDTKRVLLEIVEGLG
ncbi:MAG: phosphoglucosamine mutase [Thermoplasmata archaeon]|nr:phosphoglucosamine mutase [Thermoplasmata archaeon]